MIGSPAGPGGTSQRGLWPVAPAPAPTATSFSTDGLGKYGVYSLFPGGPTFGSALYSHASTLRGFTSGQFHAAHKVSDSLFSSSGYSTFGSPTPPPGSPYAPMPVAQLELLTKGFSTNSNSIIIQQPAGATAEFPLAVKKIQEKHCDEKCCSGFKAQKACNCQVTPLKGAKFFESSNGCSRTNPIEWGSVNVKKEPGACQVPEISTSASPIVKLEVTSPTQKNDNGLLNINTNVNNIPVGIAIARQRVQQEIIASPSLPPSGLLTTVNGGAQIKELARVSEIDPSGVSGSMAATSTMGGQGGGAILQCTDDRGAGLAAWQMGGTHNQTLATPTLWQYPAPLPVEPMVPLPVPMPPVGFQLVRDPTSGGLLLLPTTGIEPVQQAVVWPSYPQPSSVLLPSLPPMPPPPLQLLSSASSDYLSSSTTLHQHTQTHSTRLVAVTTDAKRKIPMPIPAATLIKIETDATLDQTKTLQAVNAIPSNTGAVFSEQNLTPIVTTHVIYQHPSNLILSQNQTSTSETPALCRSQATSPVPCLTPLPDVQAQEEEVSAVQDASNQTDTPICSEDDTTIQTLADVVDSKKYEHEQEKSVQIILEEKDFDSEEEERSDVTRTSENLKALVTVQEPDHYTEIIMNDEPDLVEGKSTETSKAVSNPDISGLELLSNSIVEFESCRTTNQCEEQEEVTSVPEAQEPPEPSTDQEEVTITSKSTLEDNMGGLDLLCALAEQRILEENVMTDFNIDKSRDRKRKKKSRKHSTDEPKEKKMKHAHREHKKRKEKYSNLKYDKDRDKRSCTCRSEKYRKYKTPESEEEVKKFIASKLQRSCCEGEWPHMNAMEMNMRIKLAELQREYREKQKELSKLKPKRHSADCASKLLRKKSTHSLNSDRSSTPPPLLDKMDDPLKPAKEVKDLLKPPSLVMPKLEKMHKLSHSDTELSHDKYSSSHKRKVGRPKKLLSSSGVREATETIVAKKPKSSFVYNLLAAKEKYKLQNNSYPNATPPRYLEEISTTKTKKTKRNNRMSDDEFKSSKIRPTLKAEATFKSYNEEELNKWCSKITADTAMVVLDGSVPLFEGILDLSGETEEGNEKKENVQLLSHNANLPQQVNREIIRVRKKSQEQLKSDDVVEECKLKGYNCAMTPDKFEVPKLRVLMNKEKDGCLYAGVLYAKTPPDIYYVSYDGERGNRYDYQAREDIIKLAVAEVVPHIPDDLPKGTRICAYYSTQYRGLFPGVTLEPVYLDSQSNTEYVSVHFDDEEISQIPMKHIRLLPPNYPKQTYNRNSLLGPSKRKRRGLPSVSNVVNRHNVSPADIPSTSTFQFESLEPTATCQSLSTCQPQSLELISAPQSPQATSSRQMDCEYSNGTFIEPKRLKKQDKKEKRKHICSEECPEECPEKYSRKKHKKHRKHKKHDKNKETRLKPTGQEEEEEENTQDEDDTNGDNIQGNTSVSSDVQQDLNDTNDGEDDDMQENPIDTSDVLQSSMNTNDEDEDNIVEVPTESLDAQDDSNDSNDGNEDYVPDDTMNSSIGQQGVTSTSNDANDGDEENNDSVLEDADDEIDDTFQPSTSQQSKNIRKRQASCDSRSKITPFLLPSDMWCWSEKTLKRGKKIFYRSIQRGNETITVGDSALLLSTAAPDKPYIGKIESLWESCGKKVVKVKWFYHAREVRNCPNLKYPGALFESSHTDHNDVQTISHKCEVLSLQEYKKRFRDNPEEYGEISENNDTYYCAGTYNPTSHVIKMAPEIPLDSDN